jgi:hypothetical protein
MDDHFGYITKWRKKTLIVVEGQNLNSQFHVNMILLFLLNTGDSTNLTIEQLDWTTRMNIVLNVAQGK